MTETQWRKSREPEELFKLVERTKRTSQRAYRLFAAGFWRWQANRLKGAADRDALHAKIDKLEQWAESGKAPPGVLPNQSPVTAFLYARGRRSAEHTVGLGSEWGGKPVNGVLCDLLREVFGNPFRRVKLKPTWLTSDVLALARGAYEERAFDRLPILADALQDAGCDSDDLLSHCRDAKQMHVRGCWALDLLLGKR